MGGDIIFEELKDIANRIKNNSINNEILFATVHGSLINGGYKCYTSDIDIEIVLNFEYSFGSYISLERKKYKEKIKDIYRHLYCENKGIIGSNRIAIDLKVITKYELSVAAMVFYYMIDRDFKRLILIDNIKNREIFSIMTNNDLYEMTADIYR